MGVVWEAYHKGVPLLGVPENSTDVVTEVSIVIYEQVWYFASISHSREAPLLDDEMRWFGVWVVNHWSGD